MNFTKDEWIRIALALNCAHLEYQRTSKAHKEGSPIYMLRAQVAIDLCNRICAEQGLDECFRIE